MFVTCLGEGHSKAGSEISWSSDSGKYAPYSNCTYTPQIYLMLFFPEIQKSHPEAKAL